MFQVNECEVLVDGKRKEKASPRGKMGQDRGMDTEGSIQQDLLLMLESGDGLSVLLGRPSRRMSGRPDLVSWTEE